MLAHSLPLVFLAGLANPSWAANCTGSGCGSKRPEEVAAARRLAAGACDASAEAVGLTAKELTHNCLGKAVGEVCIAQCAGGYTISGFAAILQCQSGGTYAVLSGSLPSCAPLTCQRSFPSGPGVTHDCSGVTTGSSCPAWCAAGYRLAAGSSNQVFTCQGDRSFSGTSPTCEGVACSPPSLGAAYDAGACDGKVTGERCAVECAAGYEIQGFPQLFACTAAGSFSGTTPTCAAKQCTMGVPTDVDLNTVGCSVLATGQSCTVACAEGYWGTPATFTCTASGRVVGQRPACSPVTTTTTDVAY